MHCFRGTTRKIGSVKGVVKLYGFVDAVLPNVRAQASDLAVHALRFIPKAFFEVGTCQIFES